MTNYGFVASGGGYRSFYTAGALVWLKKHDIPVVHIASTSSGNNITIDYLLWDTPAEDLPPVLTRTMRLSVTDIFHVFSNFLGLRPSLLPSGSHLFTVDKDNCRKSLQLDDPHRRAVLAKALQTVRWDILATNLTKRESRYFKVNDILKSIDDQSLSVFMDAFLAGITTIPYFKAILIDGDYYIEGGYLDNTPLASIFQDPEVDEIIACDFTDYDYHAELDKIYRSTHVQPAVHQHRHAPAGQRHSADAAEQAHLRAGGGDQPNAGADAQVVGRNRGPHVLPQADPRAAAEEPGEHDDLAEGCDRAEALLRARPRRR